TYPGDGYSEGFTIAPAQNGFIIDGKLKYWESFFPDIGIVMGYCNGNPIQCSSDTGICRGDTIQLNSLPGFSSYSWTPSASLNNSSIPDPFAFPLVTTTFTVNAVNPFGCLSSSSVMVIVTDSPTIDLIVSDSSICLGDTVTLLADGLSNCTWSPQLNIISSQNAITQAWPNTTTTYYVTGTNAFGCSADNQDSATITVIPAPVVSITSFIPDTICSDGPPIQLTGSPAGGYFSGAGIINDTLFPDLSTMGSVLVNYYYQDTLTGCSAHQSASSIIDSCNLASIHEPSTKIDFVAFPLPAKDILHIISNSPLQMISILDPMGRTVRSESVSAQFSIDLNIENLSNGLYFLVLETSNGRGIRELPVNH
ncbi:MAG TPA: T9SS type A sorting domain-containing protein, partial [Bacteroidia bacterium]|nr:T9SS type A sorting domain-containing protein [Bacteroidia bacterium]